MQFPGPISKKLLDEFHDYVIMEPRQFVIDLKKCEGMYLVTLDGQRIFDWAGYYGSKLIAHNHPGLYECDYVSRLTTAANNKVSNPDYVTPELVEYYRLLHRIAPECMKNPELEVYTINSGAEAVENALKYMVKLYHERLIEPTYARPIFISFEQGFHGRTVYTLGVTDMPHNPVVTKNFHELTWCKNILTRYPRSSEPTEVARCLRELDEKLEHNREHVAGMIIEPMQGAGGHRCAPAEFFRGVSNLAHKHGVALCFDEVQTSGGACGSIFMCDQFNLPYPPDVVVGAKKLACGVIYMFKPLRDKGVLDSTWSGTLSDMVRFVQEWKIVERENLVHQVASKTQYLVKGLEVLAVKYPNLINNIRGTGLYQGFTLCGTLSRKNFIDEALDKHSLLLMGAGTDSVRLRPNLSVTYDDINLLLTLLDDLFNNYT